MHGLCLGERNLKKADRLPVDPFCIDSLFHPKAITFIGASAELCKWVVKV